MAAPPSSVWAVHTHWWSTLVSLKRYNTPSTCRERALHTVCTAAAVPCDKKQQHYAVIGAGIAGLATTWHLLQRCQPGASVTLYEAHAIGAGGSGAAAGLLHPFSPKGKMLWQGEVAMHDALQLVDTAQNAAQQAVAQGHWTQDDSIMAWHNGIVRIAANDKQRHSLASAALADPDRLTALTIDQLQKRMLQRDQVHASTSTADISENGEHVEERAESSADALLLRNAVVLHPQRYMRALWLACVHAAASHTIHLQLITQPIQSLSSLRQAQPQLTSIIVAAGAAVGLLPELANVLPLELCKGVTLCLTPDTTRSTPYPPNAPSLLSSPYLAAHGSHQVVVGATKVYGTTTEEAWDACAMGDLPADHPESITATHALGEGAVKLWDGLKTWHVDHARLGVRALPPRTAAGALPLAGQVPGLDNVWVVAGLGARGLVYHAWLARLVAQGVVEGSDACLPKELRRWYS